MPQQKTTKTYIICGDMKEGIRQELVTPLSSGCKDIHMYLGSMKFPQPTTQGVVLGQLLFKSNLLHITYYFQLNYLVTVTYYP